MQHLVILFSEPNWSIIYAIKKNTRASRSTTNDKDVELFVM